MDAASILAWCDVQDWTCTSAELASFASGQQDGARHAMVCTDGFIHPAGREALAWRRRRTATFAWSKLKKARRWARVIAHIPFVRMIAIGNALGYGNCHRESDIDLIMITAPQRIWTVRFFVVLILKLFQQRPGEHRRDAICPSFFLASDALNLESLQIGQEHKRTSEQENRTGERTNSDVLMSCGSPILKLPPDPYLLFWVTQLTVLYDAGVTYEHFWEANRAWVHPWLPHITPRGVHPRLIARRASKSSFVERIMQGKLGDTFERWCRVFQLRHIAPTIRDAAAVPSTDVIMSDRMLKFHVNDRRVQFRNTWLRGLGVMR